MKYDLLVRYMDAGRVCEECLHEVAEPAQAARAFALNNDLTASDWIAHHFQEHTESDHLVKALMISLTSWFVQSNATGKSFLWEQLAMEILHTNHSQPLLEIRILSTLISW